MDVSVSCSDSEGNTLAFSLSKTKVKQAAKDFFKKALRSNHVSKPRVITVDKNPAYPIAIEQLKKKKAYLMVCKSANRST